MTTTNQARQIRAMRQQQGRCVRCGAERTGSPSANRCLTCLGKARAEAQAAAKLQRWASDTHPSLFDMDHHG